MDVGELALQPSAAGEGDDGADQRRARRAREPVDGERDDAPGLAGGGYRLEVIGRVTLVADPRPRELDRAALAAAAAGHRELVAPVAPRERGGGGFGSGAAGPSRGEPLPPQQVLRVADGHAPVDLGVQWLAAAGF